MVLLSNIKSSFVLRCFVLQFFVLSKPEFLFIFSQIKGDLFVTFTVTSPGSYLRGKCCMETSTWAIRNPSGESATTENWEELEDVEAFSSVYCVGGVMMPEPEILKK